MGKTTVFEIDVPQGILDDLSVRLSQTRWTDEPMNAAWQYGTNPTYLRELCAYWQKSYDWRRHERMLNGFPQFKTSIDHIDIHFLRVKGKGGNAKPLLLTHGWPDSFYRFYKVIPMLTDPGSFGLDTAVTFDVIVPSVPGFGFSDKVAQSSDKTAVLWKKLMTDVLHYPTFFAAGGDIGATISKSLANQFPAVVPAIHLRMWVIRRDVRTGQRCPSRSGSSGNSFKNGGTRKARTVCFRQQNLKRWDTVSTTLLSDWRHGSLRSSMAGREVLKTWKLTFRKMN